jgi:subtilase family serine protease
VQPPYGPANLEAAYNLPQVSARPTTIAIVDAYDDPNAESDLNRYRSIFGLGACTTANGCFRKLNQNGVAGAYPSPDASWAQEISLDLDVVSAICRNCRIVLVEANSANLGDLGTAVNTAIQQGATIVSNSYGSGSEFSSEASALCNAYYNHPGVAITASSGDSGPVVQVPAACSGVVAVGGTTLQANGSETAWPAAGGGCSAYIAKPSWQNYINTNCRNRAVADVSAVADPNTGVYMYDTYQAGGWYEAGGTSTSAPLIAGVYGLAGNASSMSNPAQTLWYDRAIGAGCLFNVPSGTSAQYAYQSGLGSPNSTGCF